MSTPPDFGGETEARGWEEDLEIPVTVEGAHGEDLGIPAEDAERAALHPKDAMPFGEHEAHAPGLACALCGAVFETGEDVRRRADGQWVHEVCPLR